MTDLVFLDFFFKRLKVNETGLYESQFPYCSPCGRELNFVRCADRPIVFLKLDYDSFTSKWYLNYGHSQSQRLKIDFEPEKLFVNSNNGRIYHYMDNQTMTPGLISSRLALEIGSNFDYSDPNVVKFHWNGVSHIIN